MHQMTKNRLTAGLRPDPALPNLLAGFRGGVGTPRIEEERKREGRDRKEGVRACPPPFIIFIIVEPPLCLLHIQFIEGSIENLIV